MSSWTGIQQFDFGGKTTCGQYMMTRRFESFYFDEGAARHSLYCRFANNRYFRLTTMSQGGNCGDTIDAKKHWYVVIDRQQHGTLHDKLVRWSHWFGRWVVTLFICFCERVQLELSHSWERSSSYIPVCLSVAESEVKCSTPTPRIQNFPTPTAPKFPTPSHQRLNITWMKFDCQLLVMAKKRVKIILETSILLLSLETYVKSFNWCFYLRNI